MKEKLKTLKDLKQKGKDFDKDAIVISFMDLKQEAISWIKFLRVLPDDIEENLKTDEKKYFTLFDSCAWHDNSNVINWIKHFFNIKEKDLK